MTKIAVPVERAALFLDLDGTLAAIQPRPQDVGPDTQRSALLKRAHAALSGRLAILSGRTLSEIDRIVEGVAPCAAGVHGLQRRAASGAVNEAQPHPALDGVVNMFEALARAQTGLLVEPKALSVAFHYRGAPNAKEAVVELAERLAASTGLAVQEGDMVIELKTPGGDKGEALAAFMAERPFQGSVPCFGGDDLTDEAGFAAVAAHGGAGVLVGPARDTKALWRFSDPVEVLAWIAKSLTTGRFELEAQK
ncbi:trehalose-phosphatase [soil metagenome]